MTASSSVPAAISLGAPGCLAFHAALTASMIGPSSIRVSWLGFCGDCPCLAERTIAVEPARPWDAIS